jgi:UDP:flavonoid glycosyltransferase YjiC (YdhE family)
MKFVLTGYGSRGDVEPCVAVGRALLGRGHEVQMAVPPNMLSFVESAGLAAVAYGPDTQSLSEADLAMFKSPNPISVLPEVTAYVVQVWADKSAALTPLAEGADLLVAGTPEEELAANVAEYHGIPLASVYHFPPGSLPVTWLDWHITESAKDAQRRALGLPGTAAPSTGLEIQAYDEICLPELAAEWAESGARRPFVGALTLELPTDADDEVLSWITAGTPPIYFGFGSLPLGSFADTLAMIGAACAELGERALVCAGPNDFSELPRSNDVKVVRAVSHPTIFPACRAAVHHGGSGTTAAGLRAGIPTLILWFFADQPMWAAVVDRLKVGAGRRFLATTQKTLVADLRSILTPRHVRRAREVATRMTKPAESVGSAADLLEDAARRGRS